MKTCKKCGAEKSITEFYKNSGCSDGYTGSCRACLLYAASLRGKKNPEVMAARSKKYHEEHREELAAKQKIYRKTYNVANREKISLGQRLYAEVNREKIREYKRKYHQENPETATRGAQARRARKLNLFVEPVSPGKVYERDQWVCQLCQSEVSDEIKYPDPRSASIDHVVPLALGGEHSYANTQLAHLGCNMRKGPRSLDAEVFVAHLAIRTSKNPTKVAQAIRDARLRGEL